MTELVQHAHFLDDATCIALRAECSSLAGSAATAIDSHIDGIVTPHVREATRMPVAPESAERVSELLMHRKIELEEYFGLQLTECEPLQFLRYTTGDFLAPHQDSNTSLVQDASRVRRISVVIVVSSPSETPAPDTYGGGALVFHPTLQGSAPTEAITTPTGTLVAFRAETTHEVTVVTHGERYSIVTWFR